MGCFFDCFRIRDSQIVSPPEPVVSRSKNALSSLFLCDDESSRKGEEGPNALLEEIGFKEVKNEAKFLKARGTLPETPVEIRKAPEKLIREKQSDEHPTPVKICEESITGEGALEETPSSCMTEGQSTRKVSIISIQNGNKQNVTAPIDACESETDSSVSSHMVFAQSLHCKNKSANFGCESNGSAVSSEGSTSEIATQHSKQYGSAGGSSVSDSVEKQMKYEASLSSWLKPPLAKQDSNTENFGFVCGENLHFGRTPGDRPIIGMVAAHWNDDEKSHISPIMWDGNGIPNSTNKYKEDQKVSWHATPFEERLEKALFEETFVSQRRHIIGIERVEFDDTEESDNALSQLQSSDHYKSVVSF